MNEFCFFSFRSVVFCFAYFEFNKLKIQIVVTLVFDISIFNDVKCVCLLVCGFFVCVVLFSREERLEDDK